MNKDRLMNHSGDPFNHHKTICSASLILSGADKCEAAAHYLRLHFEELDRFSFNQTHPKSMDKKLDIEKNRFFAIFKTKYLELTDIEYTKTYTDVEAKMVKDLTGSLLSKGFTCDEFLGWLFDVFLPVEPKFSPPMVKFVCSGFVVNRFLFENKDVMKQKQEAALRQKEVLDLISRARILIRQSSSKEEAEEVKKFIKKYSEEGIISVLRDSVELFEKKQKEKSSQESQMNQELGG